MIKINLRPRQPFHLKRWLGISVVMTLLITLIYYIAHIQILPLPPHIAHTRQINHPKGLLSQYPIRKLRMSGFLKKNICPDNHSIWGLVKSPDKNVIAVKVGDRIGKENIIITAITPSGIQLQTLEKTKCFIPATSTASP